MCTTCRISDHLPTTPSAETCTAVLHTIFFHRYFTPLRPATHDLLDCTLPYVSDMDLETLVDQRVSTLIRQLDVTPTSSTPGSPQHGQKQRAEGGRGQLVVQFMEKKRKKGWFGGKADEEMVWESWVLDVTLASPRTETGQSASYLAATCGSRTQQC